MTSRATIANAGTTSITKLAISKLQPPADVFGVDVALRTLLMDAGLPMMPATDKEPISYHPQFNYEVHQEPETGDLVYRWRRLRA